MEFVGWVLVALSCWAMAWIAVGIAVGAKIGYRFVPPLLMLSAGVWLIKRARDRQRGTG